MSDLVLTAIAIGVMISILVVSGALASLLVLLPPIRKLGRSGKAARIVEILAVAVLSLAIGFGLWTRVGAEVAYIFDTIAPPWERTEDPNKAAVVNEVWIRGLVPPPLRRTCYSKQALVCQRADSMAPSRVNGEWGTYLRVIGICLVASLIGGSLVWLFTRQQQG